ncbi:MAG: TAXI family TRAP transporter solute-binding subunit [Endozoicomonas sp.]
MKSVLPACSKLMLGIVASLFICVTQAAEIGIVTGSKSGTYYQFGLDISKLLRGSDLNLRVHNSKGSLANMYDVLKKPHAQLAIVQSDVLQFLSYSDNQEARQMVEKTRLVYPLYNEEVHILAGNHVNGFSDLEGRKVAVGSKGSGTFLTAKTILKLAGLKAEAVLVGGEEALGMLKSGEVDAMFYVAGYPVSLFTQKITLNDNLQLLEITDKSVTEYYVPSTISPDAYSWLKDDVDLVAVKAVVMTFNYRGENCQNVYNIAQAIKNNLSDLRRDGHRKWQEVDLDLQLGGWKEYGCLKAGKPADPAVPWLDQVTERI